MDQATEFNDAREQRLDLYYRRQLALHIRKGATSQG